MFKFKASGSNDVYLGVCDAILDGVERGSLIDLMSGECGITRQLGFKKVVAIDSDPKRAPPPEVAEFHEGDLKTMFYSPQASAALSRTYDVAICSDGIEHLDMYAGLMLLRKMARLAPVNIIFTPCGALDVRPERTDGGHVSGWLPEFFTAPEWGTVVIDGYHVGWNGFPALFAFRGVNVEAAERRVGERHNA